jgi:hypothetical protein
MGEFGFLKDINISKKILILNVSREKSNHIKDLEDFSLSITKTINTRKNYFALLILSYNI